MPFAAPTAERGPLARTTTRSCAGPEFTGTQLASIRARDCPTAGMLVALVELMAPSLRSPFDGAWLPAILVSIAVRQLLMRAAAAARAHLTPAFLEIR
jgi:hypothetical protein